MRGKKKKCCSLRFCVVIIIFNHFNNIRLYPLHWTFSQHKSRAPCNNQYDIPSKHSEIYQRQQMADFSRKVLIFSRCSNFLRIWYFWTSVLLELNLDKDFEEVVLCELCICLDLKILTSFLLNLNLCWNFWLQLFLGYSSFWGGGDDVFAIVLYSSSEIRSR